MESEFIDLDKAGEEVEWFRQFFKDIPLWPKPVPVICIHCDNQAAIFRAQKFIYNDKFRHIRQRHNTVKQLLSNEIISIDFISSKDNLADLFTKDLSEELINCASRKMGLKAKPYRVSLMETSLSDWRSHGLSSRRKTSYD